MTHSLLAYAAPRALAAAFDLPPVPAQFEGDRVIPLDMVLKIIGAETERKDIIYRAEKRGDVKLVRLSRWKVGMRASCAVGSRPERAAPGRRPNMFRVSYFRFACDGAARIP
jgi:hypothetical protein